MAIGGSGKGIQIVVGTDYKDKDLKRAQRDLNKLSGQAKKTQGPVSQLAAGFRKQLTPSLMLAGAAAAAFAVKFGVDGVKAAVEDQKTVEVLAQTLRNLGVAHEQTGIEDFIAKMESSTGIADERLRPALGLLVTATGDVDEAQRRLSQAMDLSVFSGASLETVAKALSRSLATQTSGTLSRYGLAMDQNAIATQGFEAALDQALVKIGGLAATEAKTLQGRLRILGVEFDNVKESFGYGFLNGIGDAGGGLDDMSSTMRDLKPIMETLGTVTGQLLKGVADLAYWMSIFVDVGGEGTQVAKEQAEAQNFQGDAVKSLQGDIPALLRWLGRMRDLNEALSEENVRVAHTSGTVAAAIAEGEAARRTAIPLTEEQAEALEAEAEAAEKAAEEFDKLSDAIKRTGAVKSYQAAQDDLRKTLEENNNQTSIFNKKGRESVDAYVDLAKSAGDYIENLESKSKQVSTASDLLDTLQRELGKTKMDPATQAALLGPFQALIDDLRESGIDVDTLQTKLDKIKSKTITVTVNTSTTGGRPPGVSADEWYGTAVGGFPGRIRSGSAKGSDTIPTMLTPGEFVIRRQAVNKFGADLFSQLNRGINPLAGMTPTGAGRGGGFQIGTINVMAAPGERAETSLPRALRRASFLAGVNG
jgi:hypothetical protein